MKSVAISDHPQHPTLDGDGRINVLSVSIIADGVRKQEFRGGIARVPQLEPARAAFIIRKGNTHLGIPTRFAPSEGLCHAWRNSAPRKG